MHYLNSVANAIDVVLGWDLPDEVLADAVTAQVGLMAGSEAD